MNYVAKPGPKGKGSINKTRDACRKLVRDCIHPELTGTRKFVLMRVIDYLNSETGMAWPSFDTLAAELQFNRSTVIRAINGARKAGVLKRVKNGGKPRRGGVSNSYAFNLDLVAHQPLGGAPDLVAHEPRPSGSPASDLVAHEPPNLLIDNLNDLGAASAASALRAVVIGVAASLTTSADKVSERAGNSATRAGEEEEFPAASSDNPRPPPPRKQTPEEFRAEMAVRGMDMAASRWGRGREVPRLQWTPPVLPEVTEPAANPTDPSAPKVWSKPTITELPWNEYWANVYRELVTEAA
jgi:hypothetical protein